MPGTVRLELPITGMHCAACVGRVQHAVEGDGVTSAVVNLMTNSATIVFDPRVVRPEALVERIRAGGYGAELPAGTLTDAERQQEGDAARRREYLDYRRKAIVALLAGGALMAVPMRYAMTHPAWPWMQFAITSAVMLWAGRAFYSRA